MEIHAFPSILSTPAQSSRSDHDLPEKITVAHIFLNVGNRDISAIKIVHQKTDFDTNTGNQRYLLLDGQPGMHMRVYAQE